MTLFIILICAAIAYAAYRYNTRYIEAQATVEEQQSVFTIGNEERVAWANRLVAEIEAAKAQREAPIHDKKVERLQFAIDEADEAIEVAMTRREKLLALYDCKAQALEAVTTNGKEWESIQRSLTSYENQLNAVETRIRKAQFTRKQALAELDEIA